MEKDGPGNVFPLNDNAVGPVFTGGGNHILPTFNSYGVIFKSLKYLSSFPLLHVPRSMPWTRNPYPVSRNCSLFTAHRSLFTLVTPACPPSCLPSGKRRVNPASPAGWRQARRYSLLFYNQRHIPLLHKLLSVPETALDLPDINILLCQGSFEISVPANIHIVAFKDQ